jgi:hypothetical protein
MAASAASAAIRPALLILSHTQVLDYAPVAINPPPIMQRIQIVIAGNDLLRHFRASLSQRTDLAEPMSHYAANAPIASPVFARKATIVSV